MPPRFRLVAYEGSTPHGVYTGSTLRWEDAEGSGRTVGHMAPDGDFGSVLVTLTTGWVNKAFVGRLIEELA